jgi:iron complex outermembrane recepter protein
VQSRVSAGKVSGDFDGLITIEGKHRDGYREHNEQDRNGIYANFGWQLSNTVHTRFYLTHAQNNEELPGVLTRDQWRADPQQAEAAAVAGDYQWNVQARRVANKTTWDIDADSTLTLGLSHEEQDLFHPIVYAPPFFTLLIDTEQKNTAGTLRYNLRKGAHDMLAGINYGQMTVKGGNYENNGGARGNMTTVVDNDADSLELFLMDRWRFAPQWTAVYGAQGVQASREIRNTNVASGALRNTQDDYDSINPRAGLIYQLTPQIELFTNLSRLYEAPTTYQLDDEASGGTLDAMHGNVFEVGTRGTQKVGKSQLRWDVAAYYAKLHDEILSIDDPASPGVGRSLSLNVDKTTHAGIEALLGASFPLDDAGAHRIEPLFSLTLNHFRFDGDAVYGNNKLPAAPDYAIRGELLYRNAEGFFVGPTVDFVGDRYADFSNTYTVDAYTLWGLRAGLVKKAWELYAEIRNITDKEYIARSSVKDVAAANAAILSPGEPRSAYVGVRLRY